jgi:5'-nucleotidase
MRRQADVDLYKLYVILSNDMVGIERPTVLVDMDGVLADFDGEVLARLNDRYGDSIQPLELDPPAFYTAENFRAEDQAQVWGISNEPRFVAELPLVENALDGWERILEAGFTPQICSKPIPKEFYPTCEAEKREWLEEHVVPRFGMWVVDTAIFTTDKTLCPGAVLIDDNPPHLIKNAARASWKQVVFHRPCNDTPDSKSFVRLNGWNDPLLSEKLREAAGSRA